jgi:hypothetical protein
MQGAVASKSKQKGSSFERKVCAQLSLWVTRGKRKDCFWRSAMSGGRSTAAFKRGEANRQAGDICAVTAEGHVLTDQCHFELKHYRDVGLHLFVLRGVGPLARFWLQTKRDAARNRRSPVLIVKQNNLPTLALVHALSNPFKAMAVVPVATVHAVGLNEIDIYLFDDVLQTRFKAKSKREKLR